MGRVEQGGISPGEPSEISHTNPAGAGLTQFDAGITSTRRAVLTRAGAIATGELIGTLIKPVSTLAQTITSAPDDSVGEEVQAESAENTPMLEQLLTGQSPTLELSINGADGETHLIQGFNVNCEVALKSADSIIPISASFQNRPNPIPDAVRDAFTEASKAGGFKDSRIVLTSNLIPNEAEPYPVIVDMPGLDRTSYQVQRRVNIRVDGIPSLDVVFALPQAIIDKLKIDRLFKDVFMQSLAFQYGAIVASGGNPQAMPDILTPQQQKVAGTITRFVKDFLSVETITQGGSGEIPQPTELFETTPQGRLVTEKSPEGQIGWKPRKESTTGTDGFLEPLNANVKLKYNPQLRGGIGTHNLWPDINNRRTPDRYGIINTLVDPNNPRILIAEYNFFRPDLKLDQATRDSIENQAAGIIGMSLSKIIYGKSTFEGLSQEQADYIGQLAGQLQDIKPLELITPTTG